MSKKVTMQDIADRLNITKVSVSKAINNQPGISEKMREDILETAKEMGYAKSVFTKRDNGSYKFAIVSSKRFFLEDEAFYTVIYYYLNKRCIEKGHTVFGYIVDEKTQQLPTQMLTERFDGIFIIGELSRTVLEKVDKLYGGKVTVDFCFRDMDSVIIDNFTAGETVTKYLLEKGHKKIGFVGSVYHTVNICDRYFGYKKALMLARIPCQEEWNIVNNDEENQYMVDIKLPDELPTAFVCHCDKAAFYLIRTLEQQGKRIPEDISVLSFDNTDICDMAKPKLTSVAIDCKQLAITSYDQMIYRVKHPEKCPRKIYLGNKIVERESVIECREMEMQDE